jgi:hypothetical protein
MTPAKLEKIRRLAEDLRGDPATRMIAKKILERYQKEPTFEDVPDPDAAIKKHFYGDPRNPPNPRMRTSDEYEKHVFMSLHNWGRSKQSNNLVHSFTHKGRAYRVVLFAFKKSPTYGWLRVDVARGQEIWSGRFNSMPEAHADSWKSLQSI